MTGGGAAHPMTDARAQQLREAIATLQAQGVYPSYHRIYALVRGRYGPFCHDVRALYAHEPTLCMPAPYAQPRHKATPTLAPQAPPGTD